MSLFTKVPNTKNDWVCETNVLPSVRAMERSLSSIVHKADQTRVFNPTDTTRELLDRLVAMGWRPPPES